MGAYMRGGGDLDGEPALRDFQGYKAGKVGVLRDNVGAVVDGREVRAGRGRGGEGHEVNQLRELLGRVWAERERVL